jgi:hypothetical protein
MEQTPIKFILPSDWFLKSPIDFEHKEYVLNSFLQKVEEALSRGEIYPYFTEISLHMASIGQFLKSNQYIFIKRELTCVDDEIMLYELKQRKSRKKFTPQEIEELHNILNHSHEKLLQYFALCKGIWQLTYESTSIKLRKNKKNMPSRKSFVVYQDLFAEKVHVWECEFEKNPKTPHDTKVKFQEIYVGRDKKFTEVVNDFSNIKNTEVPIFEVFSSQNLPLETTLLPLFKRKIHTYFTQTQ